MDKIGTKAIQSVSTLKMVSELYPDKIDTKPLLLLNKEKSGLESLPETKPKTSFYKTRIPREQEGENQDPGVNSDDEDGPLKVRYPIRGIV